MAEKDRTVAPPGLKFIDITKIEDNLVITVHTSGRIRAYKSFILDNPPRIVFDLFDIKSPFRKEQTIPVDNKWLKRIRHYGDTEKLRIVMDTHKTFLSSFTVEWIENGLSFVLAEKVADPISGEKSEIVLPHEDTRPVMQEEKTLVGANEIHSLMSVSTSNEVVSLGQDTVPPSSVQQLFGIQPEDSYAEIDLADTMPGAIIKASVVDPAKLGGCKTGDPLKLTNIGDGNWIIGHIPTGAEIRIIIYKENGVRKIAKVND